MKNIEKSRMDQFYQILNSVKSSVVKTFKIGGNNYHFKLEYTLPYGESHYSRIFAKLIFLKESLGIIKPGDSLLETTSGSGGRAAGSIAVALGYDIKIAIPAGGEKAREEAILKTGAELMLTPKESYVNGFPEFVKSLKDKFPDIKYLSHMMGDIYGRGTIVNEAALNAFRPFVDEVAELGISPDLVISPLGNGTNTLPLISGFRGLNRKTVVIGFESASSGFAYRKKYGNNYEDNFGVNPENLRRHNFPGTTPSRCIVPAPALDLSIKLLNKISLVTNDFIDQSFVEATGSLPKGEVVSMSKCPMGMEDFGRTGLAGYFVALDYVTKNSLRDIDILIPVFDASWHYDG